MRRRRLGAGASAANNAKLRIHSGDPSICTRLSRSTKRRRGTRAVSPVVAGSARTAASPTIAKMSPALEKADQNLRLRRRNQRASPVGTSDARRNTALPYIISPPRDHAAHRLVVFGGKLPVV